MEILEKKEAPSNLAGISNRLAYGKTKLILAGSSSLASQIYTSDYDFITQGGGDLTEWKRILQYIASNDDLYFIELKVQMIDGSKNRWYAIEDIPPSAFRGKSIDFVKIDLVVYLTTKVFREVSVIYNFGEKAEQGKILASLTKDLNEYLRQGKYYKALKRYFSILGRTENPKKRSIQTKLLIRLSVFFNSPTGKEYQKLNNLKAIELVYNRYGTGLTEKKIISNLKDIGYTDVKRLDEYIADLEGKINASGEAFFNKI